MTKKLLNEISYKIIGAAIEVHKAIGPGLLETVYKQCLSHELHLRGLNFISELQVPVHYKGLEMITALRCDFFVENAIVVEIKSVQEIIPIHEAQIITYLKLLQSPKGILINFNCVNIFNEGQKTYVNEYFSRLNEE